jgi:hypothetical protein
MDFFYSGRDSHSSGRHVITDEHIEAIRKLRFRMGESGYYSPMPIWSLEDNRELLEETGLTMNEIWKSVHFITMLGKHKDATGVFGKLLRRMYLDEDDEDEGFRPGYKRPFGNSDVLGDVREELIRSGFYGNLTEEELDEGCEEEQRVLEAYMKWLAEDFLKSFEIEHRAFEFKKSAMFSDESVEYWKERGVEDPAHILYSWRLDKSEIRNNKLKELGI